jgi:hypothetical protein
LLVVGLIGETERAGGAASQRLRHLPLLPSLEDSDMHAPGDAGQLHVGLFHHLVQVCAAGIQIDDVGGGAEAAVQDVAAFAQAGGRAFKRGLQIGFDGVDPMVQEPIVDEHGGGAAVAQQADIGIHGQTPKSIRAMGVASDVAQHQRVRSEGEGTAGPTPYSSVRSMDFTTASANNSKR